jgi:hypothetical protein
MRHAQRRSHLACFGATVAILAGMGVLLALTLWLANSPHLEAILDGSAF